nr:endolytic transglycosylase MltG [Abyssogena phaseoliformis symbiont]
MIEIKHSHPHDGYFWPDTYQINYGDSMLSVFKRAHQIMRQKLELAWRNRADALPLENSKQALVLAFLIEKETANAQEKLKIAGVFIRRLQKIMRLQTDPSAVYALGEHYQEPLKKRDLKLKSPYNTYRNKGLLPGPISSVGADSLYVARYPYMSDALYFVAKKDGTHAFANTYQQHKDNINKYLKNQ